MMACEYCKGAERAYSGYSYMTIGDWGKLYIDVDDGNGTELEFDISHCPMCGEKLGDDHD